MIRRLPRTFARAALLLAPMTLLTACVTPAGDGGTISTSSTKPIATPTAASVIGTWQLIRWEGGPNTPALPNGRVIMLTLNNQNELSGTGGCNRIFGQYTAGPGAALTISPPAATRMACPDMAFETRYLAALAAVQHFERHDNLLVLTTVNDGKLTYADQTNLMPNVAGKVPVGAKRTDRVLDVDSKQSDCVGVGPRKCLRVRDATQASNSRAWQLWYDPIDGFDWQPGIKYRVRIHGEPVTHPPADASSMRWTLVEVIQQTPAGKSSK